MILNNILYGKMSIYLEIVCITHFVFSRPPSSFLLFPAARLVHDILFSSYLISIYVTFHYYTTRARARSVKRKYLIIPSFPSPPPRSDENNNNILLLLLLCFDIERKMQFYTLFSEHPHKNEDVVIFLNKIRILYIFESL